MNSVAVLGYSNTGKTTFVETLAHAAEAAGLSTAILKYGHHAGTFDRPGTDTSRYTETPARFVGYHGPGRWFLSVDEPESPDYGANSAPGANRAAGANTAPGGNGAPEANRAAGANTALGANGAPGANRAAGANTALGANVAPRANTAPGANTVLPVDRPEHADPGPEQLPPWLAPLTDTVDLLILEGRRLKDSIIALAAGPGRCVADLKYPPAMADVVISANPDLARAIRADASGGNKTAPHIADSNDEATQVIIQLLREKREKGATE